MAQFCSKDFSRDCLGEYSTMHGAYTVLKWVWPAQCRSGCGLYGAGVSVSTVL